MANSAVDFFSLFPGASGLEVAGEQLYLLPQRAVWWPARRALIVSDLHLGKAAHFRKAGLPLPKKAFDLDLARLEALVDRLAPEQVIATGDLFHSADNSEIRAFGEWRLSRPELIFHLVRGNHDILRAERYQDLQLQVHQRLALGPLAFRHDLPSAVEEPLFCFTGHLHPGVELRGLGRQKLRLPCFFFARQRAILPAFSYLTGLALLEPQAGDRVFVVVNDQEVVPWR